MGIRATLNGLMLHDVDWCKDLQHCAQRFAEEILPMGIGFGRNGRATDLSFPSETKTSIQIKYYRGTKGQKDYLLPPDFQDIPC